MASTVKERGQWVIDLRICSFLRPAGDGGRAWSVGEAAMAVVNICSRLCLFVREIDTFDKRTGLARGRCSRR